MTPAEWHAEALRLADALAEAVSDVDFERGSGWDTNVPPLIKARDAARAALSLHLLAYPVGEVVAYEVPPERKFYTGLVPKTRAIISALDFGGDESLMHEAAKSGE